MPPEIPFLPVLVGLIEFGGALIVVGHGAGALVSLALRRRSVEHARLMVVEGALSGLGFKLAATLLKTIELQSPQQIAAFAAILALRTFIKAVLTRDRKRLGIASP